MSSTFRNILLLTGIVGVIVFAYVAFFAGDDEAVLTSGTSGADQIRLETQMLLTQLQELQQIKIDEGLFTDPRFMSLEDWREELPEEASGRRNPFAPAQ